MPGYIVATLKITDKAGFIQYRDAVGPVVERHGGRYIVRGGRSNTPEGTAPDRIVIIEFPTRAEAQAFYDSDDYAPLRELRMSCTDSTISIVEGA